MKKKSLNIFIFHTVFQNIEVKYNDGYEKLEKNGAVFSYGASSAWIQVSVCILTLHFAHNSIIGWFKIMDRFRHSLTFVWVWNPSSCFQICNFRSPLCFLALFIARSRKYWKSYTEKCFAKILSSVLKAQDPPPTRF